MLRFLILVAGFACVTCGCNAPGNEPGPVTNSVKTTTVGSHLYADDSVGCRFTVPDTGLRVAAEHFDPTAPPHKFKHSIAVSGPMGPVVQVDVWNNTEKLGLQPWFDKYLAFSVNSGAIVETRLVGRARLSAIIVDQKRSPQAQARRIATFAQADRVFRVTCFDSEEPTSLEVLRAVLDSFEAQVRP